MGQMVGCLVKICIDMNKVFYIITVFVTILLLWPLIIISKETWNKIGRSIDDFFGVKSKHYKNYVDKKY